MSCQSVDGGALACAPGTCTAEDVATSCRKKCKKATNNCGEPVTCGACANNELCGASGNANSCSCPDRTLPLHQYYDATTSHFCYTQVAACPGTGPAPIARLYSVASEGLKTLYRCFHLISASTAAFMLSTDPGCENLPGYANGGPVGVCATGPSCGAVPLYRYFRAGGGGDWVHSLSPTSPVAGYVGGVGISCYVWKL